MTEQLIDARTTTPSPPSRQCHSRLSAFVVVTARDDTNSPTSVWLILAQGLNGMPEARRNRDSRDVAVGNPASHRLPTGADHTNVLNRPNPRHEPSQVPG